MKILELRFKNLNSLYGEWFIDFTDPEYVSNGIFALTGPTGAGKSTILDAVCLALYGSTPRLGRITKSENEIMSRRRGECYAEVLFESQAGRFRCHWGQHRARKKPDGEFQTPRHEISEAHGARRVIESQIRRVATVIEEKTGMDFDRFTRSILLAQGGFDTFLKADTEQKSRILEQITGTGIYTEISRRVHERTRDEREKLKVLKAETAGIFVLDPEAEKEIARDLHAKQKEETDLAGELAQIEKAIRWLTGIDALEKEISALRDEAAGFQMKMDAFKPERERLGRARKAAALDGHHATLMAVRRQQSKDQASLKAHEEKLPELENLFEQHAENLAAAGERTLKAKEALKKALPIMREIRALDHTLALLRESVSEMEDDCKKDAAGISAHDERKRKAREEYAHALKKLETAEHYLKVHTRDEWLVSGLAGVEEQLSNLVSRQERIVQKALGKKKAQTVLEQATRKLAGCRKEGEIRKRKLADARKTLAREKKALNELLGDRLLREYRAQQETLLREMAFLTKIAELEMHRTRLEDGKPCPLCGSKVHPFAAGNVPVPDETEKEIQRLSQLIQNAENHESAIRKLETAESKAREDLIEAEKREAQSAHDAKTAEKSLSELTRGLDTDQSEFGHLKQAVSAKLAPLGIGENWDSDISSLPDALKKRLKKWQTKIQHKTQIKEQIAHLESEMKQLAAVIETQKGALDEKQRKLANQKKEYTKLSIKRHDSYGEKTPDDEERRLNRAVGDAEQNEKAAGTEYNQTQRTLAETKTGIEMLKNRIGQRETELKTLQRDFAARLQGAGFAGEKAFLEARLTPSEQETLAKREKELNDGRTDLNARQKDRETRLATEIAKGVTDKSLEVLEPRHRVIEENIKQLRDTIAASKQKILDNTAAKERIKEKQAAIIAQKEECHRWEKLHTLIGSADGKKYRNFAQGLTFELMVSHANRRLDKMTDRYLLIRDEKQPLELNVLDNYQAGEIRSTRNLSGGESFLVSLSLALGLSQMASRRVRVDSLFLDEGFGTLDEDALETALETLSNLHQDGKIIGVISHVPALKERIRTQIDIIPLSGGKSAITGPGVRRLS